MKLLLILLSIAITAWYGLMDQSTPPPTEHVPASTSTSTYPVAWVIDGDTIVVKIVDEERTVRLLGIDTPEVDPQYNPIECYGREATDATKRLVEGTSVTLTSDPSQGVEDKFGRLLAYVFLPDGTLVNQYLVSEGYAKEYTYNTPYQYQAAFRTAEDDAQSNERGLWSRGRCPENTSL